MQNISFEKSSWFQKIILVSLFWVLSVIFQLGLFHNLKLPLPQTKVKGGLQLVSSIQRRKEQRSWSMIIQSVLLAFMFLQKVLQRLILRQITALGWLFFFLMSELFPCQHRIHRSFLLYIKQHNQCPFCTVHPLPAPFQRKQLCV